MTAVLSSVNQRDAGTDGDFGASAQKFDELAVPEVQVAFAISRKFGSAVERNRARRRLRSALRELDAEGLIHGGLFLVVPHRSALTTSYSTLVDDVRHCLTSVGALRQEPVLCS